MTFRSRPYYWVVCDNCDATSEDYGEYNAWSETDQAWEEAENWDWTTDGERHYCNKCPTWMADDEHG